MIKMVIVDAVLKAKIMITVEALFVDGATAATDMSDDQDTSTLVNPVTKHTWKFGILDGLYQSVVETPQQSKSLALLQVIKEMEAKR
ncbi:uncharacterized protein PITG_16919 [Phytophthora infestans T30-4]|uniref:Uncharacterized protein n=1 Tax=Phytophthora infestans (strain T30-4) TaxID=403677 RepID=D0NUE3_PHYIT|nr:uncharacterized protein PITG_16919 [Phytophthora infestans T30-4]EEY65276.1 hypothetical protein PITG_16919 [Phytophthora infestans T30-4]|eukprot:XP_002897340.1 hypothetical protein PITG_16919 [Phytophthora infestans T30-4]